MVERFQMKHEHDWICARQDDKGDWVRHSDHLAIIGRIEDDRTDERVQWMGELSALKKQIEELTAALEPFARYATESGFGCDNHGNPLPDASGVGWIYLTNGDFRRARAALASTRETSDAG